MKLMNRINWSSSGSVVQSLRQLEALGKENQNEIFMHFLLSYARVQRPEPVRQSASQSPARARQPAFERSGECNLMPEMWRQCTAGLVSILLFIIFRHATTTNTKSFSLPGESFWYHFDRYWNWDEIWENGWNASDFHYEWRQRVSHKRGLS